MEVDVAGAVFLGVHLVAMEVVREIVGIIVTDVVVRAALVLGVVEVVLAVVEVVAEDVMPRAAVVNILRDKNENY